MAETPPHIAEAARKAALRMEKMLVGMLLAGESGEVGFEVFAGGMQPFKRSEVKGKTIRVNRGQGETIETVG